MKENKFEKAMLKAVKKIADRHENFKITAVYDIGDSWLFCWEDKDENVKVSDNYPVEVKKTTFESSVFVLPNERNFRRLEKAKRVSDGRR